MPAIPISPSAIAGAGVYNAPVSAVPLNLCGAPAEGVKCIPMQFAFDVKTAWRVQFGGGSPNPPISQVAGLYVDASQSTHDVNILFPDTGYQVRIEQGSCRNVMAITGKSNPPNPFFVIIDSSGELTSDIVNIIAFNQFIPEFATPGLVNTLSYGYGPMFEPIPSFTQSGTFSQNFTYPIPGTIYTGGNILISASQWYITSININATVAVADSGGSSNNIFSVQLIDEGDGTVIGTYSFPGIDTGYTFSVPVDLSGLNYQSAGGGHLVTKYSAFSPAPIIGSVNINITGGILIA